MEGWRGGSWAKLVAWGNMRGLDEDVGRVGGLDFLSHLRQYVMMIVNLNSGGLGEG